MITKTKPIPGFKIVLKGEGGQIIVADINPKEKGLHAAFAVANAIVEATQDKLTHGLRVVTVRENNQNEQDQDE